MSNMITQLIKETSGAYLRILDHRAFVKGEIDTFLNDFETQRDDKEVETIFKVAEIVGGLKSDLSEKCLFLATSHLTEISSVLKDCLNNCESITDKVNKEEVDTILEDSRRKREQYRVNFYKDLAHNNKRIQNTFEEKEEEITELYSDLERKLNLQKN